MLYQYIKQLQTDIDFNKKIRIGYEFYQSLLENPNSNIDFFDKFSALPLIREVFFELMADPDFKIKEYEYGIQSYLKYCKLPSNPNDFRDIIFAKSILLRHYYINGNYEKGYQVGTELYKSGIDSQFDFETLYIFPKLRYLAYRLLYKKLQSDLDSCNAYKQYLIDYTNENNSKWTLFEKRVAFSIFADVFSITNTESTTIEKLKSSFKELICDLPKSMKKNSLESLIMYFQENASIKLRSLHKIKI